MDQAAVEIRVLQPNNVGSGLLGSAGEYLRDADGVCKIGMWMSATERQSIVATCKREGAGT
jgi:hypothetical protein